MIGQFFWTIFSLAILGIFIYLIVKLFKLLWIKIKNMFSDEDEYENMGYSENKVYSFEAEEMADKVKTPKQLESLRKRCDNHYDKQRDIEVGSKKWEAWEDKNKIFEEAIEIAENNIYMYGIFDVDENIPNDVFKFAGKLVKPIDYENFNDEQKKYFDPITMEDAEDIDTIKDDLKDAVNDKYINQLYSDGILTPEPFVKNGYKTLNDIKKLSDEEILSIKGVGEKTLQSVKNAIRNS